MPRFDRIKNNEEQQKVNPNDIYEEQLKKAYNDSIKPTEPVQQPIQVVEKVIIEKTAPKNNKGFSYSSRNINGGKSKNFALRVEQDLFDEVQQLASDTGMSINGHIVQAIKEYLKKHSE